jgi:acetolactate synthase-1/2/3 large subunit
LKQSNEKTVAQVIVDGLLRHGVDVMFSQSLPSAVLLAAEDAGIKQYSYRTENAGTAMADCYARISGKVGVVTAQNGPAATLLVPGLAEALKASIPIVALVQEVNRDQADRNAFQELDHIGLFQACTKWVRKVTDAGRVLDYLDMAFTAACTGRPGPVVLLLPADLLNETFTEKGPLARSSSLGRFPLDRTVADPAKIAEAADLLASAKYPLVVAGGGVHISGAYDELSLLQNAAHLPVMTTVMGKGSVDERHPLSLGVTGYILGQLAPGRHLRGLIEQADVVLLIGTRTNQNGTDSWTLYPRGARYIHLDVDGSEIGRNYEALRLVGDAKLTLKELAKSLSGRRSRSVQLEDQIAKARTQHQADMKPILDRNSGPVRPERIMADIQSVLTPESIVVADASYSSVWVASYLRSEAAGSRFITPRGLAGLGWGLPMAMGAKRASPSSPVLCVVGDGGFAHVWSELETAKRTGTNIVITVLNNGILGYQKHAENSKFGRHTSACYFEPVDHARIAAACGCHGVRVESADQYRPALLDAMKRNVTTVIDVVTDPDAYPPVTLFDKLAASSEGAPASGAR